MNSFYIGVRRDSLDSVACRTPEDVVMMTGENGPDFWLIAKVYMQAEVSPGMQMVLPEIVNLSLQDVADLTVKGCLVRHEANIINVTDAECHRILRESDDFRILRKIIYNRAVTTNNIIDAISGIWGRIKGNGREIIESAYAERVKADSPAKQEPQDGPEDGQETIDKDDLVKNILISSDDILIWLSLAIHRIIEHGIEIDCSERIITVKIGMGKEVK